MKLWFGYRFEQQSKTTDKYFFNSNNSNLKDEIAFRNLIDRKNFFNTNRTLSKILEGNAKINKKISKMLKNIRSVL